MLPGNLLMLLLLLPASLIQSYQFYVHIWLRYTASSVSTSSVALDGELRSPTVVAGSGSSARDCWKVFVLSL